MLTYFGCNGKNQKKSPLPFISRSSVQDLDKVFFCWFLGAIGSDNRLLSVNWENRSQLNLWERITNRV
jgi:hypothetical protein